MRFSSLRRFFRPGCAAPEIKATEAHRKGLEPLTEDGYFAPPKPVDRNYIGYAWSRQFGPVEDATAPDIRVKKERSLNNVLQEQAYNRGISLGGESTLGLSATIGAQSGGEALSKLSGLEIISAVSLADIPFEPNVPYVTEALRLANFRIKQEKGAKAGVGVLGCRKDPREQRTIFRRNGGGGEVGIRRGRSGRGVQAPHDRHGNLPETGFRQHPPGAGENR